MGRIIKQIKIEGKETSTLFDTGAVFTYVRKDLIGGTPTLKIAKPYKVVLGGRTIEVKEISLIQGKIEGLDFNTEAIPIDEIGKADGYELDAIIGALTMEQWEISLNPKDRTLDLTGLRRREFTEFGTVHLTVIACD